MSHCENCSTPRYCFCKQQKMLEPFWKLRRRWEEGPNFFACQSLNSKIGRAWRLSGLMWWSRVTHCSKFNHLVGKCIPIFRGETRVIYDSLRNRKNYFENPAFLQIERGKSRAGNYKTSNENKNVFVFIWFWISCFWISCSWFSTFNLKKGGIFKIIFPFPYPIIYNPGIT